MKEIKVLQYKKNSKFEIEFTNLDEIKNRGCVVLFIKEGDLSPIFYLDPLKIPEDIKLFIPALTDIKIIDRAILHLTDAGYDENPLYTFDADGDLENNILPKWNIPEENAILFLGVADNNEKLISYQKIYKYVFNLSEANCEGERIFFAKQIEGEDVIKNIKQIAIIMSCFSEENAKDVNNLCKELKEKYGVEKIELFVSHCFIDVDLDPEKWWQDEVDELEGLCYYSDLLNEWHQFENIDKITTTNSTGILEVQDSEKLKVVDCVEFFKDL